MADVIRIGSMFLTVDTDGETLAEAQASAERLAEQWRRDLEAVDDLGPFEVQIKAVMGAGNTTGVPIIFGDVPAEVQQRIEAALTIWSLVDDL